jgi:hypothetical protein
MGVRTTGGVGESGSPIAYGSAAAIVVALMKRIVQDLFDGLGLAIGVIWTVMAIVRIVRGGSIDLAAGMFFGMLGIPLLYVVVCRILDNRRTRYRDEGSEGR